MESELQAANATRISRELAEIDAALDRLHRSPDRFGVCEHTGEAIPFERLDVIPRARTCGQAGT
jgi:RNA polymerase-binding transcription factor DksA